MSKSLIYRGYDIIFTKEGYKIMLNNVFILEKTRMIASEGTIEYLARCDIDKIKREQTKVDEASIQRVDAQVKGPNYGKL
tara:strand:+ start:36 stop:275 length:240 start_codon:yes stop_codon:yes gene_type:complete